MVIKCIVCHENIIHVSGAYLPAAEAYTTLLPTNHHHLSWMWDWEHQPASASAYGVARANVITWFNNLLHSSKHILRVLCLLHVLFLFIAFASACMIIIFMKLPLLLLQCTLTTDQVPSHEREIYWKKLKFYYLFARASENFKMWRR